MDKLCNIFRLDNFIDPPNRLSTLVGAFLEAMMPDADALEEGPEGSSMMEDDSDAEPPHQQQQQRQFREDSESSGPKDDGRCIVPFIAADLRKASQAQEPLKREASESQDRGDEASSQSNASQQQQQQRQQSSGKRHFQEVSSEGPSDDEQRATKKSRTSASSSSSSSSGDANGLCQSGEPEQGASSAKDGILYVSWNPKGTRLALAHYSGKITILDASGRKLYSGQAHSGPCLKVSWSQPDVSAQGELQESMLLSCGVDASIAAWKEDGTFVQRWTFHSGPVLDIDWQPLAGSQTFLSCGALSEVFLARVGRDLPVRQFRGHSVEVNMVRWAPPQTPVNLFRIRRKQPPQQTSVLFATASDDHTIKIWSAGRCLSFCPFGSFFSPSVSPSSLALDPTFIPIFSSTASSSPSPSSLSAGTGSLLQTLAGHKREVTCIEWLLCPTGTPKHPDWTKGSSLFSPKPPQQKRKKQAPKSSAASSSSSGAPLSTGHLLASGSLDATVKIWNSGTGECISSFTSHSHPITELAYSERCGWLASGAHDRVHVWDMWDGSLVKTFRAAAGVTNLSWYYSAFSAASVTSLLSTEKGKSLLEQWEDADPKAEGEGEDSRTFDYLAMSFANSDVFIAEVDDDRD